METYGGLDILVNNAGQAKYGWLERLAEDSRKGGVKDKTALQREQALFDQLQQALSGVDIIGDQKIIIAYEPIWAIGSGTAESNGNHVCVYPLRVGSPGMPGSL